MCKEEYMTKHQRRKALKFKNDLLIYDDAKQAYEAGEIDEGTFKRIVEQLDL